MKKVKVIINEQHQLLKCQETELNELFGANKWEREDIPARGLDEQETADLVEELVEETVVFLSPVPLMIALRHAWSPYSDTYLFFNPNRVKKEIKGKIIYAIPQEGWEILQTGQGV